MSEIRVLIADDHPIVRRGLCSVIDTDPKLKIVSEAEDGEVALEQIRNLEPEVAVLDLDMPNQGGLEVLQNIKENNLSVSVILLTVYRDERFFNAAMDRGAKGYVLKDSALNDIIAAIKAVATGQNFISPQLSTYLLNRHGRAAALRTTVPGLDSLTPRETEVLRLIAGKKTSKEIGRELFIDIHTVEKHRANICEKLSLHGSHALLNFALDHKSELL